MSEPTSITIQGVPAAITRAQAVAMVEALGIDPMQLTHLEMGLRGLKIELKSRTGSGRDWIDPVDPERLAKHVITIPIVDG